MTAPLAGLRVVEVANWVAGPAACALFRDMGAEVLKVEPPAGDTLRQFKMRNLGYDTDLNTAFEIDNRGKRSIVIDLEKPSARGVVERLVADADVFLTNLTTPRREKYGLTFESLSRVNPRLVYTSLTGYGTTGPDQGRPGFDFAAFWARSGLMGSLGEPPSPPPLCRGGQGDHTTALNLVLSTLLALRVRDQTGRAQYAEVSLYGTGMWTLASDLSAALVTRTHPPRHDRTAPANPIWNTYRTSDGRWILLVHPDSQPFWPRFCAAVAEPGWAADPRFDSPPRRTAANRELAAAISERFARRDYAHWAHALDREKLIWAPVATLDEVVNCPQARSIGAFAALEHPQHGRFETMAAPFALAGAEIAPKGCAPELGAHSREALAEHGFTADEIARLAAEGVFG
jgi:crotonobetainyl-CoA:carnitine CoA-transferase CaiB-like acyl-CoA transferase